MRTVRTLRSTATEYCAQSRTGFTDFTFEDRYDFYALTAGEQGAIKYRTGKEKRLDACLLWKDS